MIALEMVHARRVSMLQNIRLEYGLRQYLKTYCYECIQYVYQPHFVLIDYKEFTFCSLACARKSRRQLLRTGCKRQKRKPDMDDLCRNYQA
jgi:hypothetical protein